MSGAQDTRSVPSTSYGSHIPGQNTQLTSGSGLDLWAMRLDAMGEPQNIVPRRGRTAQIARTSVLDVSFSAAIVTLIPSVADRRDYILAAVVNHQIDIHTHQMP